MYGLDDAVTREFGTQCLISRRLAEAGVRFIELSHGDGTITTAKEKIKGYSRESTSRCRTD
jgi:hypothetical protein